MCSSDLNLLDKQLVSTEIVDANNALAEAVIGELVTYSVTVTVPEAKMPNAVLTDTLDSRLAFVSLDSVTTSPGVSITGSTAPVVTNSGGTVTFNLGTITNSDRNNATKETITFVYKAVVLNKASAQGGDQVRNRAALTFDGAPLEPVGMRLRGNSTFQDIDAKCAVRFDTDRYADLRLRSLEHLVLTNLIWDASSVREQLAYALFRALDVPSARTAHAWVDIDGEPRGLYLVLEAYDADFLKSWFGHGDGTLWEPGRSDLTGDPEIGRAHV